MGDHLATISLVLDEFLYRLYGQPGGPAGPRGLPLPGPAASAAPQPLPLGRLCRPPAGGHHPPPATAPAGDPAGLAVAPGLHPRLGPVGPGAGLDAGAGGSLLG